ncbi:ANTAR domain-containing protein [Streptomyces sp. NPDC006285]|uniref:ANTAR domain-containing response regulator n=1 Tax=Streptomyces sp. NPDC006285 TaxID=3364742 RepID=UPI0036B98771
MKLREQTIGAVNLFDTRPRPLSDSDVQIGQAIADVATIAILQQRTIEQVHAEKAQLQHALTSRVVIEQAKGILAERHGLSLDDAFATIRAYVRPRRLRLAGVCQQIIDDTFDGDITAPPTDGPAPQ